MTYDEIRVLYELLVAKGAVAVPMNALKFCVENGDVMTFEALLRGYYREVCLENVTYSFTPGLSIRLDPMVVLYLDANQRPIMDFR